MKNVIHITYAYTWNWETRAFYKAVWKTDIEAFFSLYNGLFTFEGEKV